MSWGNGWWACQDLNLGPHPYQQSRAHRCAERRFPRSPPTVRGEVMRSNNLAQTGTDAGDHRTTTNISPPPFLQQRSRDHGHATCMHIRRQVDGERKARDVCVGPPRPLIARRHAVDLPLPGGIEGAITRITWLRWGGVRRCRRLPGRDSPALQLSRRTWPRTSPTLVPSPPRQ